LAGFVGARVRCVHAARHRAWPDGPIARSASPSAAGTRPHLVVRELAAHDCDTQEQQERPGSQDYKTTISLSPRVAAQPCKNAQ
jgi:hypothetical protein